MSGNGNGTVCLCCPKKKAKTVKKKTKVYWRDFASTTVLQGFDWIEGSRCQAEKVIFIALIVCGVILTIKDVWVLCDQFQSEEKQTTASIMDNDTFIFNMTLCIDIETASLKTPGVDVGKSVTKLLEKFESADVLALLADLSNKTAKKWSNEEKSLVSVTAMMLSNIVRVENVAQFDYIRISDEELVSWGLFDKIPGDPTAQNFTARPKVSIRPGTDKTMYQVNQFYARKAVPFDQLLQAVGACLCKWMKVTFMPLSNQAIKRRDKFIEQCRPDRITWLGASPKGGEWENLCVKPDFGVVRFDPELGFLDVSFEHKNIHSQEGLNDDTVYNFYVTGATAMLDFSGNRVFTVGTGSNTELIPITNKRLATLRINGYQMSLSTGHDPCASQVTRADCWMGCRAAFTAKNCHCWPLSAFGLPSRPDGMELCGSGNTTRGNSTSMVPIPILSEADTCGQITNQSVPDADCKSACLQNCEYALLGITHESFPGGTPPSFANMTYMRLTVQYFQYPFFQQDLKMKAGDFFNQLGGALGLYIGCSFIALAHIIIFPTHMIMECLEKRRKRKLVHGALNSWLSSADADGFDYKRDQNGNSPPPPYSYPGGQNGLGKDNRSFDPDSPTVITVDDEV